MTIVALTIAGSDSGGGAGIQQDLKVFAAFGLWGASAVTAVTVQDTLGVRGVHIVPWEIVAAQIDAVASDLTPAAVKTGMLPDAACVRAVCDALERHARAPLVLDPVMVASDGTALVEPPAIDLIRERLVPLSSVVTPNASEAAVLTGEPVESADDQERAARALVGMGAGAALITGGHLPGDAVDVLFDGSTVHRFGAPRDPAPSVHGTGCVLSAAIAAGLALGRGVYEAVEHAKGFVTGAIASARQVGRGVPAADAAWETAAAPENEKRRP